ncbi:MAG: Asp23/Gls24 family envelope stress response protein [Eubacteriales bacterium]|nr:Asp23/Gls24 family envelope stress response protein [Christensenellaceae bacterium]MDY6079020.1 Asp23/Gls24 family envelope stress response protein [Eubacteriales bacterium]
MSKVKSNTEVYAEIIADIAARAATVEGVRLLGENPDKFRPIKDNDVHAYFNGDGRVNIDIYLNVLYGYNIPDTVCKVQIAIKDAIEKETCYKVQEVNVSVMGIIVDDEDEQPVVVHEFSEEEDSSERTEDKK